MRADTAFVTPHDPMRVVCTGDWVAVEPAGNPRYVRTYLPRRTAFVHSTSSKRSEGQILAANVDYAVVAVSLAVELDLGRVERFLALARESGMTHAAASGWTGLPQSMRVTADERPHVPWPHRSWAAMPLGAVVALPVTCRCAVGAAFVSGVGGVLAAATCSP